MSVLIKGMKMPKSCNACMFDVYGLCLINKNIEGKDRLTHSCPLIEIPPHGDLIDKQETDRLNRIDYEAYGSTDWTDYARFVVLNSLKAAPIIIEAEEGGDTNGT